MAVAMRYSFPYLRDIFIETIVKNNININFFLKITFTNYKHLSRLNLDTTGGDWAEDAKTLKQRLLDLENTYNEECKKQNYKCNLKFNISVFDEIPQRHGIHLLLEEEHLFLSVSDIDTVSFGFPMLSVGTNQYRHHTITQKEGQYWIKIFRHWFSFYSKYQSFLKNHIQMIIFDR
jgi:hypothetical protein